VFSICSLKSNVRPLVCTLLSLSLSLSLSHSLSLSLSLSLPVSLSLSLSRMLFWPEPFSDLARRTERQGGREEQTHTHCESASFHQLFNVCSNAVRNDTCIQVSFHTAFAAYIARLVNAVFVLHSVRCIHSTIGKSLRSHKNQFGDRRDRRDC
jgi:hypothetical protein